MENYLNSTWYSSHLIEFNCNDLIKKPSFDPQTKQEEINLIEFRAAGKIIVKYNKTKIKIKFFLIYLFFKSH